MRKCLNQDGLLCSANKLCESCKGLRCNRNIFPADRLTCFKCSGTDCLNPLTIKASICDTVEANDQCVTTFDDGNYLFNV